MSHIYYIQKPNRSYQSCIINSRQVFHHYWSYNL